MKRSCLLLSILLTISPIAAYADFDVGGQKITNALPATNPNDVVIFSQLSGGGGGTGTASVDDSTFVIGTENVFGNGALADEVSPDAVDEGDIGLVRMSLNRVLYNSIRDGLGNERGAAVSAANALKIDGSAVTQPISGTITANIGTSGSLALDASVLNLSITQGSTTSGQRGALHLGAVTTAAPSYTTGQSSPLSLTLAGALRVDNSSNTQPVSGTVTANQGGTWTVQPGNTPNTSPWLFSSGIAHDGVATSRDPLLEGCYASAAAPTDVSTDGDAVRAWCLRSGARAYQLTLGGVLATTGVGATGTGTQRVDANLSLSGVASATGNGVVGTGVQRVAIASDNTAFSVNAVQSGAWSLSANQSVNEAQINGVTPLMGNGVTGTGSQRVTIASDNTAFTVNSAQSGTWTVQPGNTANTTPWLVNVNDQVGGAGTLGALNATATLNAQGAASVGMMLAAGTLIGTIVPEVSYDGGSTWTAFYFEQPSLIAKTASIVFASSNPNVSRTIVTMPGASNYRVRVSAYTSGTANCTLRGSSIAAQTVMNNGTSGATSLPPAIGYVGGQASTSAPSPTDATLAPLSLTTGGALRIDESSIAGTAAAAGNGATTAGTQRVTISNDSTGVVGVTGVSPGTGAANSGKAEDAAAASGDTGAAVWGVRRDTPTTSQTSANGDYSELAVDQFGAIYNRDRQIATYSAGTTIKTATTSGTGPWFSICGSSTKTIRIQRFAWSSTVATAAVFLDAVLKKTSTATSAGTTTALTKVPHDSNSAASTAASVNIYTALGTAGTGVGVIYSFPQVLGQVTATVSSQINAPVVADWTAKNESEAIVLRGTAQCLEASFGTAPGNIPTLTAYATWTEE